jgi:hypothetical protein
MGSFSNKETLHNRKATKQQQKKEYGKGKPGCGGGKVWTFLENKHN